MPGEKNILPAVALPGLALHSLGNYLASLGLLRALCRAWPTVRAAWRDDVFHIVGGPADFDALIDAMLTIADTSGWSTYRRGWADAQKASTAAKCGAKLAQWQASADEDELELFAAHAAPAARVDFNPLLGSGGNAGKRSFAQGRMAAIAALQPLSGVKDPTDDGRLRGLHEFLMGKQATWTVKKLNAASWFSDANKLYNSGQRAFREGSISPWAMALACEGLPLFAGGASRRLGSRARATGAFPFIVGASAPHAEGEAGRDLGEVWAPVWNRPMTVPEVVTLFARGRAEVGGRGALTPSAFAVAALARGVDAGITEFRRFVLGRTTSANTFEPRYAEAIRVPARKTSSGSSYSSATLALERLLALFERLPRDRKVGDRWRFVGLRGSVEEALVRVAAFPNHPEAIGDLLDGVVRALDRVDRNKAFRDASVRWDGLPPEWLSVLMMDEPPSAEARLALALVTSFPVGRPFTLYRFGVELQGQRRFLHPERTPATWIWRPGPLPRVLGNVLHRRTLDWEADLRRKEGAAPSRLIVPACTQDVAAWLAGDLDEALLVRWLSRLALFDWTRVPHHLRRLPVSDDFRIGVSGALSLFGLLHPLFDLRPVRRTGKGMTDNLMRVESRARTPVTARRIVGLLRTGQVAVAVDVAKSRYAMARAPLVKSDAAWSVDDPERLLAAFLIPVSDRDRARLVQRWLRPRRHEAEVAFA